MAFELFVNGTLMRGLALHGNLAGAEFLGEARTAPIYRLYSIDDRHPGMFEVAEGGVAVAGEIYRVPDEVWRRVEAGRAAEPVLRAGAPRRRARDLGHPLPARARRRAAPGHLRATATGAPTRPRAERAGRLMRR